MELTQAQVEEARLLIVNRVGLDALTNAQCNLLDVFECEYQICFACKAALPITIHRSAAGFYIGTFCEKDGPHDRYSVEYYPSRELAQEAKDKGAYTPRF